MDGREFIATVRLSDAANTTLAVPGERCDRVPAASLPWLLAQGLIVPDVAGRDALHATATADEAADQEGQA